MVENLLEDTEKEREGGRRTVRRLQKGVDSTGGYFGASDLLILMPWRPLTTCGLVERRTRVGMK